MRKSNSSDTLPASPNKSGNNVPIGRTTMTNSSPRLIRNAFYIMVALLCMTKFMNEGVREVFVGRSSDEELQDKMDQPKPWWMTTADNNDTVDGASVGGGKFDLQLESSSSVNDNLSFLNLVAEAQQEQETVESPNSKVQTSEYDNTRSDEESKPSSVTVGTNTGSHIQMITNGSSIFENIQDVVGLTTSNSNSTSTILKSISNLTTAKRYNGKLSESNKKTNEKQPLNILVLYPDDWRYDSIGGVAPYVQTPFLNELARDGIRFTRNCVTSSVCWVSRATFFTGQYAARHQSLQIKMPLFHNNTFLYNRTAWPVVLQDAGYYTGHIGKWQFADPPNDVRERFFNWTSLHEGRHWYAMKNPITKKKENVHAADRARNDVFDFLEQRPKDKPFSLSVAFYPPKAVGSSKEPGGQWDPKPETAHLFENVTIPMPEDTFHLLPPPVQVERVGRGRWEERFNHTEKFQVSIKYYYRMIYEVDQACKDIVERLKSEGLYDNTLVIFTTDNGFFLGEHGLTGKWYPYEESIRVPLIIHDPRMPKEKRNTLDDSFTLSIDLASTILGAAGLKSPSVMQGRDIADLYLRDSKDWRQEFYYEYPIRQGPRFPSATALVRKDYKYMYWPQMKYECLYNLEKDPQEMTDLSQNPEYREILWEMRMRHDELSEQVK